MKFMFLYSFGENKYLCNSLLISKLYLLLPKINYCFLFTRYVVAYEEIPQLHKN